MSKTWCLYVHISPSNKKYFGVTCKEKPEYRWGLNGNGYKNNVHFRNAIAKYGWDKFEHKIIKNNLTKEDAMLAEKFYIALFKTQNPVYGYNITAGGEGMCGVKHTPEEIEKIRESNRRRVYSDSTKQKIRDSVTLKQGKPVKCFLIDGTYIGTYKSTMEAERKTGVKHNVVSYICKGKKLQSKGYTFRYDNNKDL